MPALYSLVYVSEATRPLTEADLGAMLYVSRLFNAEKDVTGLLIFERSVGPRGGFVQCLEGTEAAVELVFKDRIVRASQHTGIEVTWQGPIDERVFPDWSMKYARSIEEAPKVAADLLFRAGWEWS